MTEQQEIKGVEEQLHLKYRKLREGAHSPTRATLESIGYDLKSPQRCEIKPKTSVAIATGLAIEVPIGHYGRLAPKSKLAWEYSMIVLGGVIDPDYTEEISVMIYNLGEKDLIIEKGQNYVQLILEKASILPRQEVNRLKTTTRGLAVFEPGLKTMDCE